jgi:hypothetical protein
MKIIKNLENKLQVFNEQRGETDLREYVEACAESDPNFFRWLFDAELDNDFNMSLTDEQREAYNELIKSL